MATTHFVDARPQVRYWIPEGYVTEKGLRADVRALARRGFGAIEVVAVNFFNTPMPDDCRWGTSRYYEAVRVVLQEASALGLAVDIANGPGWPISVPHIKDADDSASLYELTYGLTTVPGSASRNGSGTHTLPVPERRVRHDEGTPRLVAACAYRLAGEKMLDEASYVDLLPNVRNGAIEWQPPADASDWAVFCFWGQPACHKVLDRHYVIDHLSREGAKANAAWWRDELFPALGDEACHLRSLFCDSLEYRVAMEWTRDLPEVFERRNGYSILPYLPVVGELGTYPKNDVAGYAFADADFTRAVRHDYLQTLSWMYAERHVKTLCDAAAQLGKTVRYQVAYNKPFCEEDASAIVHVPENESLGRQSLDNLRIMAGATHLMRKPRYSFEAAAEFGYGYGQTQNDMMWWLKRAAIAGCNAQVFHGAAYCGDGMEHVTWPGWEAWNRLCSNNWGRTLSERSFAQMTRAIERLNSVRRGRALVDLAFVREEYLNDGHGADGEHVVRDGGLLCAHGYSYEFLSPGLLEHENARVDAGRLDPEGGAYKALVLAQEAVATGTLIRLASFAQAGLPVFVIRPRHVPYGMSDLHDLAMWRKAYESLVSFEGVHVVNGYEALLRALGDAGVEPDASYEDPTVFAAHVRRANEDVYLLYNGNRVLTAADGKADQPTYMPRIASSGVLQPIKLEVSLAGEGWPCLMDLSSGLEYALEGTSCDGRVALRLCLEADQLVAVRLRKDARALPVWTADFVEVRPVSWSLTLFELNESGDLCDFLAGGYRELCHLESLGGLICWDELDGVPQDFVGYGEYRGVVDIDAVPERACFRLPRWCDAVELEVNDEVLPVVMGLNRTVDVRDALHEGANAMVLRAYTTLSPRLDTQQGKRTPTH